jgi:TolB-like protein/Flp pilus assembly protein TadD
MSFINELKRRNVFRVAAAYIVSAWLIIQVAETIFPLFGFSDVPARYTVILLAIGFPLALLFSWVFEFTPEGLKRETDIDHSTGAAPGSGKQLDRVIIGLLAVALAYFAFDKFVMEPSRVASLVEETAQQARTDALIESYGEKSIAVLPFADMSVSNDQEYMSDGIAEELLNLLAKVPELRVVSRSSAFAFKGKDIDIPSVASQLNVAYILEGSVRQAGDQLRITAQLIEAHSDTHLWSETYDRKLENIFQIQDEISAHVVEELKITLLGDTPRSQQIDKQAYKLALQARYFWNRRAEGDEAEALKLYQQSLELAPDYAPAWAGVSVAYAVQANKGQIPREEGFALAREAAERALQLDPNLADAHIRMGQAMGRAGDVAGQRKAYKTALSLEPRNPTALGVMATITFRSGKIIEAIELYRQAEDIDPLGAIFPLNTVDLYLVIDRFEDAENAARRAFELNGNEVQYFGKLSYIYSLQKRYHEALEATEKLPADSPDTLMGKAVVFHGLGRLEEAKKMVEELDAMDTRYEEYKFAMIYAQQGDADAAFEWLNKIEGVPRFIIQYEPSFKPISNDPRWGPALERFEARYLESE